MVHTQAMGKSHPKSAKGALPHYADGGFVGGLKRTLGLQEESPELAAYKAKAAAERAAAKAKPAQEVAPAQSGIADYVGNSALQRREKIAGMAAGGYVKPYKMGDMSGDVALSATPTDMMQPMPLKVGGAIRGPGTGTSDDVPIMASNGEFMIKAAAVKKIGLPALEALNEIADGETDKHEKGESKKVEAQEDRDEQAGRPERDGMKMGGAVRKMAGGGIVTKEDPNTDLMGNVTGATNTVEAAPKRSTLDALADVGKTVVSAPGYGFSTQPRPQQAQAAMPDWATSQGSPATSQATPMSGLPATGAGAGRGFVNPTMPAQQAPRGALPTQTAAPAAPSNQFGDGASWNSNRTPMNAQDQGAMDGIQARQDARDSAGLQRMQYNQEVADAQAVNKWNADRFKSPRQLALEAQTAQGIRADATERYKADQNVASTKLSTDANRYGTDALRESAKGQLGVAQGRLAMDQESQGYDNRAKGALEKLQVQLDGTTDPAEQESLLKKMMLRTGKGATQSGKDRYMVMGGGQTVVDGVTQTLPQQIFDMQERQIVGQAQQKSMAPPPHDVAMLQKDPSKAALFDQVYGQGAAKKILGK